MMREESNGAGGGALSGLERDAMAWPPARHEVDPTHWRPDVETSGRFLPEHRAPLGAGPDIDAPTAGHAGPNVEERQRTAIAREFAETLVLIVVIFVGIRSVVQNFRIEGQSMEPTLHSEQFVLVNKLAYFGFGKPQRGDIVVFEAWDRAGKKDFIKRIVGVPGDVVEIRDGSVIVGGDVLDEPYLDPPVTHGTYGPITLGEDEYYALGDNRGNSSDSRSYGVLPGGKLIGKAWFTYWPPGQMMLVPDGRGSYAETP